MVAVVEMKPFTTPEFGGKVIELRCDGEEVAIYGTARVEEACRPLS